LDVDKSATQEKALQFTKTGQYALAIAEWKKLLTDSPEDAIIHNTIGDLNVKHNALADAVTAYFQAANLFRVASESLKAIAILKKVVKLDPAQYQAYQDIAEMHAERGLVGSAIADYTALAKLYLKDDRVLDAVALYRTMVSLDPSRLDVTRLLAELCLREHLHDEAAMYYLQLGRLCMQKGQVEEARQVYDTILSFAPENQQAIDFKEHPEKALEEAAPEVSFGGVSEGFGAAGEGFGGGDAGAGAGGDEITALIDSGEYDQAEAKLVELMGADPANLELYRQYGRLYLKKGDVAVARGQFQYAADTALQAQDFASAEATAQEYLAADPTSAVMRELLGRTFEQKGDAAAAVDEYGQAIEALIRQPEQEQPATPEELYERLKNLAPDSPWAERFAEGFTVEALEAAGSAMPSFGETPAPELAPSFDSPAEEPAAAAPDAAAAGQTRYELGVAYRDMGLLAEAMAELAAALDDPTVGFQALGALVDCHKEQGASDAALACLEKAAETHALPDPLQYELGVLYLKENRPDRAAEVFARIPEYRDVRDLLARLRGAARPADPVAAGPGAGAKRRRVSYL
jgi:tetratricopeptide (TPR) repeat protein